MGEGTRPDIRTKHCLNSQKLHRHEQSYPCTDVTSQTQRLLLISVYPSDWVCFTPVCMLCGCACAYVYVCVPVRLYLPVHVCVCTQCRSCVCVHACVDPCAFASIVPSHFLFVVTCRCGMGCQNKRALTRALARIQARMNSLKLEGGKHRPRICQSPAPQLQAPTSFHRSIKPHCQTP